MKFTKSTKERVVAVISKVVERRREGEERRQEMERERRAKALSEPKKHFSLRAVKRHANGTIELGVEDKSHAGYEAHL